MFIPKGTKLLLWIAVCYKVIDQAWGSFCESGQYCKPSQECCHKGCCDVSHKITYYTPDTSSYVAALTYNDFFIWSLMLTGTVILVVWWWWFWKNRNVFCSCRRHYHYSDRDSTGSCYYPPQYSRCNSIAHPPPYIEVTAKPDLYPLVLPHDNVHCKNSSPHFMVQFFKNRIFPPNSSGTPSATSTTESINSSFICNAANEANSIVPPTYSCAGSFEEWQVSDNITTNPRQALLRSVSTMSWRQPVTSPPTPLSAHFPYNIDSPSQNSSIIAQYFNDRITSNITLDLGSPELNPVFCESFRNVLLPETRFNINDIDLDLIDYEISNLTEINNDRIEQPSQESDTEKIHFAHSKGSNCMSPPQPTSPTFHIKHSSMKIVQETKFDKPERRGSKNTALNLNTLVSASTKKCRPPLFGPKMFSLSAPNTPSGVSYVPTVLGISHKKLSKSGSNSRLKADIEEGNPLLSRFECDEDGFRC